MTGDTPATVPAPIVRLVDELQALERAYSPGGHGRWSARRRSELVDAALVELFEIHAPSRDRAPRVSLVALGGYGRGALCPRSDVDLLLLHDDADPDAIAAMADGLWYPLWDAGFTVGHAVRTPGESAAIAAERLDATTAMLDARWLAGDPDLFQEARVGVLGPVRDDPTAFIERLGADARARRERYGSTTYLLEPELKEGGGGLRDLHALGWVERALGRTLEDEGWLRPAERDRLDAAEEFLTRVRSALHLETGRSTDRLLQEQQPVISGWMGFRDEPRLLAVDALMRAVFEHARAVDAVTKDVVIYRRRAVPRSSVEPVEGIDAVLRSVAASLEEGRSLTPGELDAAESATTAVDEVDWSPDVRDGLLRVLRLGRRAVAGLEILDDVGALGRLIPEWADVRCRPQRDPYHRYTVDVHLLRTLGGVARSLAEPDAEDPVELAAARHISDADGILLGALLHDVGKNGEGGHVEVGTRVAGAILARMRLPAATAGLALFMVEQHLLLPDTATRRDLTDDDLILDIAARVGSPERLAALYLLAKADARATGPAAWTSWRQTLIRELVAKIQRAFDRGEMGEAVAQRLTDAIGRVRDLLADQPAVDVDRFVLRMPRSYFLSIPPAQIARQFATIGPDIGRHDVRTVATPGSRAGSHELLVVAADRPGLLSWIAGALSLAGLSILTAQIFTTEDGVAVDVFEVEGAFDPDVSEERWRAFRGLLRRALDGRISLEHRMNEKRRHYPLPAGDVPVTVGIDNDASDFFTVVEIGAPDRVGLLFDITRTLAELALDVHLAKVATYTGRVIDAFYVRDQVGRKLEDADRVRAVGEAMRGRLERPEAGT